MTTALPVRVSPGTVDETVDAVRQIASESRPTGIVGAGTEWASLPHPGVDAVIDCSTLSGIVDHEPEDLTVTVLAGTRLEDLADELAGAGQDAVLPEVGRTRTVGGVVGSAASGYRRLRYGPTRDRVIGVQLVTGYGVAVRGGGRLVKNVTGYDLPRLVTGSRGALGVITEVTLKVWPTPRAAATVTLEPGRSLAEVVHRPAAVLETPTGVHWYLEGSDRSLRATMRDVGGEHRDGHHWPDAPMGRVVLSVRVPPRHLTGALDVVRGWEPVSWVAQHGVGIIDVAFDRPVGRALDGMRERIRTLGGFLVVEGWPDDEPLHDRFGHRDETAGIARRLRREFDPHGVFTAGATWSRT